MLIKDKRRLFYFGLALGLLIVSFFYFGAYISCSLGGGHLTGLSCQDIRIIGVCEFNGGYYKLPESSGIEAGVIGGELSNGD